MKQAILQQIKRQVLPILKEAKVKRAALFGSYVRGDDTNKSDIDILVDFPRGKTLFDLVDLKMTLEKKLRRKVDVVTYEGIHPSIEDSILGNQYPIL